MRGAESGERLQGTDTHTNQTCMHTCSRARSPPFFFSSLKNSFHLTYCLDFGARGPLRITAPHTFVQVCLSLSKSHTLASCVWMQHAVVVRPVNQIYLWKISWSDAVVEKRIPEPGTAPAKICRSRDGLTACWTHGYIMSPACTRLLFWMAIR